MATKLDEISGEFRKNNVSKNSYNENDNYNSSNKNAISDGDERGKDGKDTVGGLTDIKSRKDLLNKNVIYNESKPYDSSLYTNTK